MTDKIMQDNQMYLTHLIGQDIDRIRHEIALLCRRSRVEQALSLRMVEQQTGGAVTAKQLDKIETEQKQKMYCRIRIISPKEV